MKRKEYRSRLEVLLSVERDRWPDFVDLCDREHKSTSLKFSEMLEEELQKNAIGEANPIRIRYGEEQNKPSFLGLDEWIYKEKAIQVCKKIPRENLWQLKSASNNMRIAYRFRTQGVIEV